MIRGGVRRFAPWLVAAAAYTALTFAMMWPLVSRITSGLPHDAADPALNTWILWWNAHTVPLTARWWSPPIFWPVGGALAFSEHLLGISVVTTPLQWLGASPVTAYNVAFLASFPLSALAAHALAWTLVGRHDAAALAGLAFGFSPYRVAHAPHLQVLWAFGMPIALLALHRYVDTRQSKWLAAFAAAWVAQALSNGYYLLFFPVLLAIWVLWFTARRSRADALAIAGVWLAASLTLAPFLWAYARIHAALDLQRARVEIEQFSADVTAVFAASPDVVLWHRLSSSGTVEGDLFPGALVLALVIGVGGARFLQTIRTVRADRDRWQGARLVLGALTLAFVAAAASAILIGPWRIRGPDGLVLSVSSVEKPLSIATLLAAAVAITSRSMIHEWRRRSVFAFYVLGAALTFVLSLGPHAKIAGAPILFRAPYYALMQLPGFSSARAPARFGMLFVLCMATAAALAFARLTTSWRARPRQMLALAAGAMIVAEGWPAIAVAAVPAPIHALERLDDSAPIVELPLGLIERDSAAVYRSMLHRRPLVNGYSGFVPPPYRLLTIGLRMDDAAVLQELARGHPLIVIVDHHEDFARWSAIVDRAHGRVIADDGEWRVYRLDPTARDDSAVAGAPLRVQAIEVDASADLVSAMTDGNPRTAWTTRRAQTAGEQVTIDLGSERSVSALRLMHGIFPYDFPRRLAIDCADDTGSWTECWHGSTAALALRGILDDSANAPVTIPIGRDHVRRLRLSQTGADADNGWSIVELTVFGR